MELFYWILIFLVSCLIMVFYFSESELVFIFESSSRKKFIIFHFILSSVLFGGGMVTMCLLSLKIIKTQQNLWLALGCALLSLILEQLLEWSWKVGEKLQKTSV
jgi:hypothetical protein